MRGIKKRPRLTGDTAYYPFGVRRALRKKQRRRALALWIAGTALVLAAGGLTLRQTFFRGGQPTLPPETVLTATSETAAATVQLELSGGAVLPRYRELYAQNRHMVGWLSVPGAGIDLPVVQTPGDNEYYLHRGFDGYYSISGTLFLDKACRLGAGASANWVIYGHNMADGSMFGQLTYYADEDFWRENPTFRFDTLTEEGEFAVVAALYTTIGEDALPYYTFFDAGTEDEWQRRYDAVLEKALYDTGVTAHYGQQLVTLSTCGTTDFLTDQRFAVLAVRVG